MTTNWEREVARCEDNARDAEAKAKLARERFDHSRADRWLRAAEDYRRSASYARSQVGGRDGK